jgi:hypothetical protein
LTNASRRGFLTTRAAAATIDGSLCQHLLSDRDPREAVGKHIAINVSVWPGFDMLGTSADRVDIPACYLNGFLPAFFVLIGSLVEC